jgi:formylglycine-generating enzyme required for sulfatase activity
VEGFGAVPYTYRIGVVEVTIGQYTEFLNAVAAKDPYGLYNTMMATTANVAGIERSGSSGSHRYSVIGSALRPITYVSWWDAARFCNWLHNGQGSEGTEQGAYPLAGAVEGIPPKASPDAKFTIPTEAEWFKAAYYKAGSLNAGYWAYATQSDEPPGNQFESGSHQANYRARGLFCLTQSAHHSEDALYLTDVGAFSGSSSAYGTFDQQGNVQEWNDLTGLSEPARGLRGGSWYQGLFFLNHRNAASTPTYENSNTGFRVVSPAPEQAP